jgi:hypothetical protein
LTQSALRRRPRVLPPHCYPYIHCHPRATIAVETPYRDLDAVAHCQRYAHARPQLIAAICVSDGADDCDCHLDDSSCAHALLHAAAIVAGATLSPPMITAFAADRREIIAGETVSVRWQVANAETVTLQAAGKTVSIPAEGRADVLAPPQNTTYLLAAANMPVAQSPPL